MKTRKRLSNFQKDVLWTSTFLILVILSMITISRKSPLGDFREYLQWIGNIILCVMSWMVLLVKCVSINVKLYKMYILKEKIYEIQSNKKDTKYYYKLLRPFFFFPIWNTDWHYSLDLVEKNIENKKKEADELRKDYFEREVISIKKHK